jgi:hypothetical protein
MNPFDDVQEQQTEIPILNVILFPFVITTKPPKNLLKTF